MFLIFFLIPFILTIFLISLTFRQKSQQTNQTENKANSILHNFKPNFSLLESDFSFNFLKSFYPLIFGFLAFFWIFWLNLTAGFPFLGFAIFGISLYF